MKFLTLFLIIVCGLSSYSQKRVKQRNTDDVYAISSKNSSDSEIEYEAPKKAWKIIVKNNLTADENFTLVGQTLADNDFVIDKKDKEFYTIKTVPKEVRKRRSDVYFLTFSIKNNSIAITGQFNTNISLNLGYIQSESSYSKITNKGMSDSSYKNSFNAMHSFAFLLGKDLEYVTE